MLVKNNNYIITINTTRNTIHIKKKSHRAHNAE